MINITQGTHTGCRYFTAPGNTTSLEKQVEWVLERPYVGGAQAQPALSRAISALDITSRWRDSRTKLAMPLTRQASAISSSPRAPYCGAAAQSRA